MEEAAGESAERKLCALVSSALSSWALDSGGIALWAAVSAPVEVWGLLHRAAQPGVGL